MAASLGITERTSALLAAMFFLGYLLFQVPGTAYAARHSIRRIIFISLILWGVFSSLTGLISDIRLLLIDRFLLGVAEGVVMPALLVYLTRWFTRTERSRANAVLILGNPITLLWASVASGFLVQRVGWRVMFICEGAPSILWAFVWWYFARDRPSAAGWLAPSEAQALEEAIASEQKGLRPVANYRAALKSRPIIFLALQLFFWSVGLYGFALWLPKIVQQATGRGMSDVGLLSAAPYMLGVILMIIVSAASDRTTYRKRFVWPFLLLGGLGFCAATLFGSAHLWLSFSCMVLAGGCTYAGYAPFFAIVPEVVPTSVLGESMAFINAAGAVGSFTGSYAVGWLNAVTGSTRDGFIVLSCALVLSSACMIPIKAK